MNSMFYIKLYLLTVPVFFLIDILWLGWLGRGFYKKQIGFILSDQVNWPAAIAFYLIYIAGILIFAVVPALEKGLVAKAVLWGALFGFFTYATYDLTNMATIRGWPIAMVAVDILWGTLLCALVATGSFYAGRWLMG
ncbi:membrane protein [Desulfosarcina alkanivorans]|uniref:Membrane protein n=2 Tax=Desulfosarcina alkanivorans TaxID=571177 RepID=A0A5K7Z2J5_9BACT|nr:membrane protein [Desulfosarcina alkanivorans]